MSVVPASSHQPKGSFPVLNDFPWVLGAFQTGGQTSPLAASQVLHPLERALCPAWHRFAGGMLPRSFPCCLLVLALCVPLAPVCFIAECNSGVHWTHTCCVNGASAPSGFSGAPAARSCTPALNSGT